MPTLSKGLYDSYMRAIRWASDRVGERGIIGFVTNANFIEATLTDGVTRVPRRRVQQPLRLHLRGNQRTAGELSRKEGGKVFGSGSRAPVAISLLVKSPKKGARQNPLPRHRRLSHREQKLAAVAEFGSVKGISAGQGWSTIEPDTHGDWLRQRDESFARHMPFGVKDKDDSSARVFGLFSLGVLTARDAWASSPSKKAVSSNMRRMIDAYTSELARFNRSYKTLDKAARIAKIESTIDTDPKKIAWSSNLKDELARNTKLEFYSQSVVPCLYRPFTKQWTYFDRKLNERVYRMPRLFPFAGVANRVIGVSASESRSGYSVLMSDVLPSYHATDMVGSQYFPLYVYEEFPETDEPRSSRSKPVGPHRQDGITDEALAHFQAAYSHNKLTKEDVFYYMYGLLHSPDYRQRYADNLGKELPRAVRVKATKDFWAFSRAGRSLADLHVKYDEVPEFAAEIDGPNNPTPAQCRVEKMRFGRESGAKVKSIIQYNAHLTVRGIPLEAYDYVVSGKPAIEWVMDRQTITTDKDSGIVKDVNEWASETMEDPRYPLSLLLRVVTVSLETMKIVRALPPLELFE